MNLRRVSCHADAFDTCYLIHDSVSLLQFLTLRFTSADFSFFRIFFSGCRLMKEIFHCMQVFSSQKPHRSSINDGMRNATEDLVWNLEDRPSF